MGKVYCRIDEGHNSSAEVFDCEYATRLCKDKVKLKDIINHWQI